MKDGASGAAAFVAARDFLLRHRADYDRAYGNLPGRSSAISTGRSITSTSWLRNDNPALWIVDSPDDAGAPLSFREMSGILSHGQLPARLGVSRGDRLLLMLPNRVELWDVMLAAMKLGAVVLPATTQLSPDDVRDRVQLGEARFVVVDGAELGKFEGVDASVTRIAVGERVAGWHHIGDAYQASPTFVPDGVTRATDLLLLYFTSGTTSKPKLVEHTHQSYPVGHLSTMYWIGLQPGDIHWNISSPGWAKHAWSCFFAPWNAQACVFIYNFARFVPRDALDVLVQRNVTTLCAPPTVWRMLVQEPLASYAVKLREIVGAGEPLNPEIIERVQSAWGITIRDGFGQTETTCQIGNPPGQPVVPGSMGRPLPGTVSIWWIRMIIPQTRARLSSRWPAARLD
jgi:acetyl-CoA synthetase